MHLSRLVPGFGLLVLLACVGCQDKVAAQTDDLYRQNRELQSQLDDARAKAAQQQGDSGQVAALRQQLADKDAQIAALQAAPKPEPAAAAPANQPGLEGFDSTYDPKNGTVTVTLSNDVLFDSGKATLKTSSEATLDKMIRSIESQYPGKQIYVDGHTDSDKVSKTRDMWADNRDLSYARAKAVTDYLTEHGINPKVITIRAYGEYKPKATKAASRRVEIVVVTR